MLLHLYSQHANPGKPAINGGPAATLPGVNGHADYRIRDAEEFELEGLMTEDEGDGSPGRKKENGRVV